MSRNPDELAELRAWIAKKRQERERQTRRLNALVKQRRIEAGNAVTVLHFYGETTQAIALVQIHDDGTTRITRYTDIGPMSHTELKDPSRLAEELHESGFDLNEDPNAGVLLEEWTRRPRWAEGLKSMEIMAIVNSLSYHGLYKIASVIQRTRSTKMGYYYCRQFGVTVWE
jgi:hypothetical protein